MPKPLRPKQSHHKKKKKDNKTSTQKDFDIFRHEIYKLGLTGLDKKDRLDARVELAIKLGAKSKPWINPSAGLGADSKRQDGKAGKGDQHIKVDTPSATRSS